MEAHDVGVGVVVREMLGRMQFVATVDDLLGWDPDECRPSAGTRLLTPVIAIADHRAGTFMLGTGDLSFLLLDEIRK